MFDIGWTEMMFVVIVAVLVIGPKDLPRALSTVARYIRKARSMARDFQSGLDDLARETELDEIKKDLTQSTDFNIKKQVEDAVDPTGSFENMFNDVKPEIRDPRLSANNYSKPDGEESEPQIEPAKTETPAPQIAEKSSAGESEAAKSAKPETKAS